MSLIKNRLSVTTNILETTSYFFSDPKDFDLKFLKKFEASEAKTLLSLSANIITNSDFNKTEIIKEKFGELAYKREISFGKFLGLFRVALIGKLVGADLFETMRLLGKKTVLKRILFLSNYIV